MREALKFSSRMVTHILGSWLEKAGARTEKLSVLASVFALSCLLFAMMCV